ncbi:MAG: hypothetical protein ACLFR2_03390 [Candidatus Kapaibacterium sp.]
MNNFFSEIKPHLLRALNGPFGYNLRKFLAMPEGLAVDIGANFLIIKKAEKYSLFAGTGDSIIKNILRLPLYFNILHFWDKNLANRFYPRLNAGFDFLESFPDADPETSSVDGFVMSFSSGTLTEIISSQGSFSENISQLECGLYSGTQEGIFTMLSRAFLVFDISALPQEANITAASLRLNCHSKSKEIPVSLDDSALIITGHSSASDNDLTSADFSSVNGNIYGMSAFDEISLGANNTINLNSSFIQYINGLSHARLSLRIGSDVSGSVSAWEPNSKLEYSFISADNASPGYEPMLRIDFFVHSSAKIIMMP